MRLTLAAGTVLPYKLKVLKAAQRGWTYLWGAKITPLALQYPDVYGTSQQGERVDACDCSADVLWSLYHLTGGEVSLDPLSHNSTSVHGYLREEGYECCLPSDGHMLDGKLRLYYLPPESEEAPHILLVCMGMTFESNGTFGPTSQAWGSRTYHKHMIGLELT